jgi:hypothetical protein
MSLVKTNIRVVTAKPLLITNGLVTANNADFVGGAIRAME